MPPLGLRPGLWKEQGGTCLYTGAVLPKPTAVDASSLDHVVPWARVRVSAVENFVLTTASVNSAKSSLLVAPSLVRRWADHVGEHRDDLRSLALEHGWSAGLVGVVDVAGALYERAGDGTATWAGPGTVVVLDDPGRAAVADALASLSGFRERIATARGLSCSPSSR